MADVEMTPLHSSHVVAAGFDRDSGTLVVEFKGGKHYSWAGVTEDEFDKLVESESPGKYLRYELQARYGNGVPSA